MSTKVGPYPSYGSTQVPWLNETPTHWKTARLDRLFNLRNEQPQEGDNRVTGYLDGRVTLRSNVAGQKIKGVIHEGGWQRIYPGDFAISGMNAHLGGMGISDSLGKCSPIYLVLQPRPGTNAQYVSMVVRQAAHLGAIKALVQTIRFNSADMKRADLKSIYVQMPPPDEQEAIVHFIRYIDHRVNRLLKTKRRLIELLNEQKQAIIHRAVTRGLDPTVPLKPSGVEWLGDIPAHWRVAALWMRYSVELGKMLDAKRITGEASVPYLRNTDVQWDAIRVDNLPQMDIRPDEYSRYMVQHGDLLVCEGGEVGRAALWVGADNVVGYQKALHRLRPVKNANDSSRFLMHALFYVAHQGIFKADGNENTIAHLTGEKFRKYRFPFPPLAEQLAIVRKIDCDCDAINRAVRKATTETEFIREYRTRLVADVVTGQLDVRGLALPEDDAEEMGLDIGGEEIAGLDEDEANDEETEGAAA